MLPWLLKYFRKPLNIEDIDQCPDYDKSQRLGEQLEIAWNDDVSKNREKPIRVLWNIHGNHFTCIMLFLVNGIIVSYAYLLIQYDKCIICD